MKLYKIVFNLSNEFNINREDIDVMRSIHHQAAKTFDKMKNKNRIDNFIADFNEIYNHIITIYEGQVDVDEKLCTDTRIQMVTIVERAYNYTKGKNIFSIYKSEGDSFISRLRNFIEMFNKSRTLIFLLDLSKLTSLNEDEVKELIKIKKQMESQNIELAIITDTRRIVNIFDAIEPVEDFPVFPSELQGVLGIFDCEDSFFRISKRVEAVQYE